HVGLHQLDRLALVWRLVVGEALLELALPVAVGLERVPAAPPTLGVQRQQLAGELLRGSPRARLHRLPARSAEFAQGRVRRAGANVTGQLRQLVHWRVDAIIALVFEIQVVARHPGDGARLEAGEARDAVVFVHDDVAGAQLAERAQHPPAR